MRGRVRKGVRYFGACKECGMAVCVARGGRVRPHHEGGFCSGSCLDAKVGRLVVDPQEAERAQAAWEARAPGAHHF